MSNTMFSAREAIVAGSVYDRSKTSVVGGKQFLLIYHIFEIILIGMELDLDKDASL